MATITKRRGRFTIRFTSFHGPRRELYGFPNERLTQRIDNKIDNLVAAHKMDTIPE